MIFNLSFVTCSHMCIYDLCCVCLCSIDFLNIQCSEYINMYVISICLCVYIYICSHAENHQESPNRKSNMLIALEKMT